MLGSKPNQRKQQIQPSACANDSRIVDASKAQRLTPEEQEELKRCEDSVFRHLDAFVEAGRALAIIRKQRLYRDQFKSFEEYCRKRWNFSRVHGIRLSDAADVIDNLLPMGYKTLPTSERQVRPIARLSPEQAKEVWSQSLSKAGSAPVTEPLVRSVVEEIKSKSSVGRKPDSSSETWQRTVLLHVKKLISAVKSGDRDKAAEQINSIALALEVGCFTIAQSASRAENNELLRIA